MLAVCILFAEGLISIDLLYGNNNLSTLIFQDGNALEITTQHLRNYATFLGQANLVIFFRNDSLSSP